MHEDAMIKFRTKADALVRALESLFAQHPIPEYITAYDSGGHLNFHPAGTTSATYSWTSTAVSSTWRMAVDVGAIQRKRANVLVLAANGNHRAVLDRSKDLYISHEQLRGIIYLTPETG